MRARGITVCVVSMAIAGIVAAEACSSGGTKATSIAKGDYVVLAWNDLGMHCLNPTYDQAVILPPYNVIWAQVIHRGDPPRVVTDGLTVEYRLVGNTYSYGKARYGQFWDLAQALFGAAPARDHGLNLVDPAISNGLAGAMVVKGDRFEVDGIPAVPMGDDLRWDPYQVAEITVKDAQGSVLVTARNTVPTSDELDCAKCHGADPFGDLIAKHDAREGTRLAASEPVLCASCHASPALGQATRLGGRAYLSEAIHSFHGGLAPDARPACYDCHPGRTTQCNRSLAHTAADGNCTHCHGTLEQVGGSVAAGTRVPWLDEPSCVTCHAGVDEVDTGATLYRHAKGHGGIHCAGCHGSPHTMIPSRVASDQAQAIQYQGAPVPLGDCTACHGTSHGGGLGEFDETHGGASPQVRNACMVCHTAVPGAADVARWPHGFGFKDRAIAR